MSIPLRALLVLTILGIATAAPGQINTFTVTTGGNHTVEFMGTREGDHTAFLSYVVITPTQHR